MNDSLKKRFSVPFNNDFENYVPKIIPEFGEYIHSAYMSFPPDVMPNARPAYKLFTLQDLAKTIAALSVADIKTYIVINGAWSPLTLYTSDSLSILVNALKILEDSGLSGMILSQNYLVNYGLFKKYVPNLKLIASVNQTIDSYDKADMLATVLEYDGLVWDRSLNRTPDTLGEINRSFKTKYPDKITGVMVNEGCLLNCPFKREHDNCIAMLSYSDKNYFEYLSKTKEDHPELMGTLNAINPLFGCHKAVGKHPELLNTIPYINPEDLRSYYDCGDIFKIAGRTHSTQWIHDVIGEYINEDGKLSRKFLDSGLGGMDDVH